METARAVSQCPLAPFLSSPDYASNTFQAGIKFIQLAPQQHARIVERRGALFRDVIHRIDAQLKVEGLLDIPCGYRLAEAVFAVNALATVNNTTPYNAV